MLQPPTQEAIASQIAEVEISEPTIQESNE